MFISLPYPVATLFSSFRIPLIGNLKLNLLFYNTIY